MVPQFVTNALKAKPWQSQRFRIDEITVTLTWHGRRTLDMCVQSDNHDCDENGTFTILNDRDPNQLFEEIGTQIMEAVMESMMIVMVKK